MAITKNTLPANSEPAWLTKRRAAAADAFFSLPLPSEREEAWRYTTLGDMPINSSSDASLEISGKYAAPVSAETEKLIPAAAGEDKFDFFNKAFWTTGY
ncbi:MAG: hypothetical protein HY365_00570, partial [Candidatus Aenigmarchaeota archaeon]|nr:hypothetical protein [Candidatus Aenigmarchaeota archaeon]